MRHFLISALLLSLVAGCSSVKIGPHRIDVQQGNALDQENVSRLKTGLNRSQVRFLLGTPLVVDPFRTDRWDYVYVYYKAGKLAEQKRITLFFEGDTLTRIEGDMPVVEPTEQPPAPTPVAAGQPQPKVETPALPSAAESRPMPAPLAPQAAPTPVAATTVAPATPKAEPVSTAPVANAEAVAAPARKPGQTSASATNVVPPLPSPKGAPPYVDPRPPAELSLQSETDVAKIQPDVRPPFPGTEPVAAASDAPVLQALNEWAAAWARRDSVAYLAAYDDRFVPQGGGSRADWEKRKRQVLNTSKNIEIDVDSPTVARSEEGAATVTFKQYYRSDSYRDAVIKQLLMVEHDGRWLIVEEKVLSVLHGAKP